MRVNKTIIKKIFQEISNAIESYSSMPRDSIDCSGFDLKLKADLELDKLIVNIISRYSTLPIISEERVNSWKYMSREGLFWVVDPLDGSFNFSRELPFYAVSIALCKGATPVVGFIYDLYSRKIYSGLDDSSLIDLATSSIDKNIDSVIATGFPVAASHSPEAYETIYAKLLQFKKVRMYGSAVASLLFVAMGKIDAYYEKDIFFWDVAAGVAMVAKAGGQVQISIDINTLKCEVFASNGHIDNPFMCSGLVKADNHFMVIENQSLMEDI